MTDEQGWTKPETINFGASSFFNFRLCQTLIDKGVLTNAEAADVFVKAANDVRSGSEDGAGQMLGEVVASRFEVMAGWLLGQSPKL